MNCPDFQNQLQEYLEGSLSTEAREAAGAHLAGCVHCRQAFRQEQQVAQLLSNRLRKEGETVELSPELEQRILASLKAESAPKPVVVAWDRFAWPLGIAAGLLLAAGIFAVNHFSDRSSPVSIQAAYPMRARIFRREDNKIIDTLSYEPVAVSETIWTMANKSIKREGNLPL